MPTFYPCIVSVNDPDRTCQILTNEIITFKSLADELYNWRNTLENMHHC